MELTRPGYAVIYVILLCALAQGGSEGKEEENYRDGGVLSSPSSLHNHIHRKQAENEWKHCRKELTEKNNDVNDFDLHPPERSSDMSSILSIEKNIHKTTKSLSPHMKKKVLDCTRKSTTPPAPVSKEKAGSRHLLTKHSRSTLGLESGHHRRSIAESPHDQMSPASPSHEPTPASSPASPTHEPTPASSPASPTPVPTAIDLLPLPLNMFVPFSPPPPPHIPRPPSNLFQPITNAPVPSPPSNDDKRQKTIILAATLSGIIILIGLALCCREARRSNRVDKDDRPFLILTSSDYSGGSQKVVRLGDADKEEPGINNGKNPSNVRNWSMKAGDNNHASVVETTTSDGTGQVPGTPPGKPAPPPPGPPPPPPPRPPAAPRPPPPPRAGHPPPAPPKPVAGKNQLSSLGPLKQGGSSEGDAAKPKLKPFFWDKVSANPDQSMVWHEINAGSFVFNEEKMQSLFCCTNQNKNERKKDSPSIDTSVQYIQIIDPRKAQNLTILLRALNVTTDEVIDALKEGNEIPVELIHTLLKMAPTAEEELKLRLFSGELSQLGPAERFLKFLVDIPFAFKRLESLMFMLILREEATTVKESFATLEVACSKLRKSRLFLKLLEAVLKTGNRMNDGTYRGGAQAFRLDTLLKLSDVKGTDGKTTLLHFVVQEIIRSEGIRAVRTERASRSVVSSVGSTIDQDLDDDYNSNSVESAEHYRSLGLEVVSGLSTELEDVKKAALIDGDALSGAVSKLGHSLVKTQEFLDTDLANLEEDECSEFKRCTERFLGHAREEVTWMVEEEKRIMALVKSTADYFHGNAGKDEGLRLFLIVRDFLIILDKVCKEVRDTTLKAAKAASNNHKKEGPSSMPSSPDTRQQSSPLAPPSDLHRRLFPAIAGRRVDDSSSSDDDDGDEEKKNFSP